MTIIAVLLHEMSTAEAALGGAVSVVLLWLVVKILTKEGEK